MRSLRLAVAIVIASAASLVAAAPPASAGGSHHECELALGSVCIVGSNNCLAYVADTCVGEDGEYCSGEPGMTPYCEVCETDHYPAWCFCYSPQCHIIWGGCGEVDRRLGQADTQQTAYLCYTTYLWAWNLAHGEIHT